MISVWSSQTCFNMQADKYCMYVGVKHLKLKLTEFGFSLVTYSDQHILKLYGV